MTIKEVDLTQEEVNEIQDLNTELITFKNLIKEMDESTTDFVYNKIIKSLKNTQFNYDAWFVKMQNKHSIMTMPENRWNVDFDVKKLQLLK